MKTSLCVTTVAQGNWQGFAPLFIWCARHAWPDYDVMVFFPEPIRDDVADALYPLGEDAQVHWWEEQPDITQFQQVARVGAALRWMVFVPDFASSYLYTSDGFCGYDAIYTTDVDMLMMPEDTDMFLAHLMHCQTLGLPYSNLVRAGAPVLTGLHFASEDFLDKVGDSAVYWMERFSKEGWGVLEETNCIHDERLLWQIVRDAHIGFPAAYPAKPTVAQETQKMSPNGYESVWFRPNHGIHLGYAKQSTSDALLRQDLEYQVIKKAMISLGKAMSEPGFWECYDVLPDFGKGFLQRYMTVWNKSDVEYFRAKARNGKR